MEEYNHTASAIQKLQTEEANARMQEVRKVSESKRAEADDAYRLKMGLTRELNLSGKTPWASFGAAIYVDVKNENSIFEVVQKKNRF